MAQTRDGAIKVAASKCGLSVDEYLARTALGQKRCTKCKQWRSKTDFNIDRSRFDGLAAKCHLCTRVENPKTHKGRVSTFKGRNHTLEARQAMGAAKKGRPSKRLGVKHTAETRLKISQIVRERAVRGVQCSSYKDGKCAERRGLRFSALYKRWRFDVFARDRFTCQECGDAKGGNLNAHHIKSFADHPELRFDVSNGVTLCEECHDKRHFKPDSFRNRRKKSIATR